MLSPATLVRLLAAVVLALAIGAASADAAVVNSGKDQVVITGGAIVPPGSTVGDVVVVDGPVRIAGHATGDVVAISGPVNVAGRVDGDVATVSDRATLAPTARVGGDLRYGDERPVIANGARVGGSVTNEDWSKVVSGWGWVSWLGLWLAVSVSTLIVAALLLALAPRALDAAERAARQQLGATIGWGLALAIGLPIVAVVAFFTLVGIPFGIGLLLALLPLLAIAYATGAWILGRRIVSDRASPWVALLAGWAILRVLALLPVAGALVGIAATVVGLGALAVALWHARQPRTPRTAPEGPPGHAAPA